MLIIPKNSIIISNKSEEPNKYFDKLRKYDSSKSETNRLVLKCPQIKTKQTEFFTDLGTYFYYERINKKDKTKEYMRKYRKEEFNYDVQ